MNLKLSKDSQTLLELDDDDLKHSTVLPLLVLLYVTPEEERDAILLHLLGSASSDPEDMAEALGVKASTIVKRYQRSRKIWKSILDRGGVVSIRGDVQLDIEENEEAIRPRKRRGEALWGMSEFSLGR